MNQMELLDVINKKTIPLLLQYFRNDINKVKEIIEDSIDDNIVIDIIWYNESGLLRVIDK